MCLDAESTRVPVEVARLCAMMLSLFHTVLVFLYLCISQEGMHV